MKKTLLLILIVPLFTFAQNSKKDSTWLPLKSFIGQWTGEGGGEPARVYMKEVTSLY